MEENNEIDYDPIKSEADKVSVKQAFVSIVNFLKNLFQIHLLKNGKNQSF